MTQQRRHDTRVALRRAVAIFGPETDDTRLAAIQFCYAHEIEPHWRYAVWPRIVEPPKMDEAIKPFDVPVEYEWQRVLRRFIADKQSLTEESR